MEDDPPMSDLPVLGRTRELEVLRAAVAAAFQDGAALLMTGEPGIGKSVLLASARATARADGCVVLCAAGVESEMHLPFGGVQQALAPLLGHLADLPESQRNAVTTALALSDGASPDLFLIAEGVLALLSCERRKRPVVVVVDDVQWLDPQSQQILAFVARRGATTGLCVIAATRPEQP